ncbi:hypothetical protein N4R57_19500 [Rhodobacteraceae bacterium D3-12]|nr:hypothetical protein N4R57_19500 [Rhodobacteraceae bacterium D3-12]
MAATIFTPIQPALRPLGQTAEASILERVFLYGSWEELCLMQDFIYFAEPMPYAERDDFSPGIENLIRQHIRDFQSDREDGARNGHRDGIDLANRTSRLYTWHDAESVTQKISNDMSDLGISSQIMDYRSLRVLGAGIQNVLPLIGWVNFLKFYCKQRNIKITTFTFFHKTPSEHCGWFREEMKDVVNRTNEKSFIPAGAACDRTRAKLPGKVIYRGVLKNSDQSSESQNVIDGIRQTTPNVTDGYETTYHFFGASEIFGTHLSDAETIPANFATLAVGANARVLNYGMGGVNFIDVIVRALSANVASGDTIFLALPFCAADFSDEKIVLDEYDFFDQSHVKPSGAKKSRRRSTIVKPR